METSINPLAKMLEAFNADKACDEVNASPLVQRVRCADRAAFCAGYETAKQDIAQHLSETLPKVREALEYIESSARGSKRAAASWCKNLEGDFDVIEHKARECLRALTKLD